MEDWWEFKGTHKYLTASKLIYIYIYIYIYIFPWTTRIPAVEEGQAVNDSDSCVIKILEHWQVTCKLKPRIRHGLLEQNQIPAGCCHPGTYRLQLLSGNSNGIHNGGLGCWHWGMEETGACRKLTTAFSHTISSPVAVKWWLWNFVGLWSHYQAGWPVIHVQK
jgi:hypothetical protein